ncbi:MAG: hypothetical protein H7124_18760 [Phycisphaerales bacterium]|nr:hypothetical protein [Hyphomonadaceae bacterium]
MLLRRVIAHFRKQEWTAIAIDFVIVVVGVFIGIQVANWNAARVDDQRAHSYLERISDDLDTDLANYADRLQFWSRVSSFGRTALAYAETGDTGDLTQWELLLAYFQASQVAEFVTTDATYDELKSAGELGLITNLDLRNALAGYYTNAGNPALSERPAYRMHVRGVIPVDVQSYIWTTCYGSNPQGEQVFLDCAPPIGERRAADIVNRIKRDEALMAELRYWVSTMQVAAIIGRNRTALATEVRAAVAAELAP